MARVIQQDAVIDAEEGDLRVWWIRNVPNHPEFTLVDSPQEAATELERLAQADLKDPRVQSNAGGLEVFEVSKNISGLENGGWTEWYDDDTGCDIRDWAKEHGLES